MPIKLRTMPFKRKKQARQKLTKVGVVVQSWHYIAAVAKPNSASDYNLFLSFCSQPVDFKQDAVQ